MSRMNKKLLISGPLAGLILSLGLPLAVELQNPGSQLHAAGPGPQYSKPWKAKPGTRSSNSNQPKSSSSSSLLDSLRFKKDSPSAPANNQGGAFFEAPGQSHEAMFPEQSQAELAQAEAPRKRGVLNRLFGRFSGDSESRPVDSSQPQKALANQSNSLPLLEEDFFVAPDSMSQDSPAQLADSMTDEVDERNMSRSVVIIPPQPLPNLLPGTDYSEPVAAREGTSSDESDPFPLPPLPDGFEKSLPKAITSTTPSDMNSFMDTLIPPLPESGVAVKKPVAASKPVPAETKSTPEPLPMPEVAAVEPTPVVIEEEKPGIVQMPVMQPKTPQVELNADMLVESAAPTSSGEREDEPEEAPMLTARKRGETETNLPLAPSADEMRWQNRRSSAQANTQQQPVTASNDTEEKRPSSVPGWKNRSVQTGNQEPNTLSIPEGARPTELPKPELAKQNPQDEKYRLIAERGERTGFKGFCPVALKDHLELADASPVFRSEFEGQVYYFSSEACQELFEADPLRYVPAQGGIDLVKYLQEGKQEPGRLDFAVWYQDRLFLFSSESSLQEFRSQPSRFIDE